MALKSPGPFRTTAISAICYYMLSRMLTAPDSSPSHRVVLNRAISAGHATITTFLALYAIISIPKRQEILPPGGNPSQGSEWLDDSRNPLIQDRDELSNMLTAWETGYLIYDTLALVSLEAGNTASRTSLGHCIKKAVQRSPVFAIHHVLLTSGLLYLQTYISRQKEKGIRIITALILMNASTPLLHVRWWARRNGKSNTRVLDLAFTVLFALSRFGPIVWVMREYGHFHGMSAFEAWNWLRRPCRAGMLGLFGMNAAWWLLLVKGLVFRSLKRQAKNG